MIRKCCCIFIGSKARKGLSRLNGMFAFAIWDNHTKELFIARDRMGVKPLYYAMDEQSLFFSSELTPIYCSGLFALRWDYETISDYLAYWYICEPKTIFKEIKQLPPGHYALIKCRSYADQPWWQIPALPEIKISFSPGLRNPRGPIGRCGEDSFAMPMFRSVYS